jgi:hypothetical protein
MDSAITAAAALSDAAYLALSGALKTFNDAQQPGSVPDTEARQAALNSADAVREGVVIAANSGGADLGSAWVTQAQWNALDTAYNAAHDAATKNAVAQAISDLNDAITVFNNAKTTNGPGTKEETAGSLTISGLDAFYKDGTSILTAPSDDKSLDNPGSNKTGTITNGSLTIPLGGWNGSNYFAFTSDNRVVFISKEKVDLSSETVSMAYTDFEFYTWSVKFSQLGGYLTSSMTLDAFLLASSMNIDYDGWRQGIASSGWLGNDYANLDFLDVAFYKDAACTQEFKGSDMVDPDTVVYSKFSLRGNNEGEGDNDPVDTVGHITGTISFTGYTGQQVRINAEFFGENMGGYWVDNRGSSYTVSSGGSFSIPFTQGFLTALNAGTLDLRFQLYIGSGNSQFSKRIEPMIQVTASQLLSNGNLNVGSQGPVSLASITLSGTITVTHNGQPVPRVEISTSGGFNYGNTTLTSPGPGAQWSMTMPVFDSSTYVYCRVYGYDSQGNRLFYRSEAASVSGVSNTNVTGVTINLGNITTTTLNGTVNVTIGGQKPYTVEIFPYTDQNNWWGSQIGSLFINDYASKPNTFSMTIETPAPGTVVYFQIDTRMSNSVDWGGYQVLQTTITIPSGGAIPPVALTYDGSGN